VTFCAKLTGFETKKTIALRYKDRALLEKLVAAAAQASIFDLIKVDYVINDLIKSAPSSGIFYFVNRFLGGGLSLFQAVFEMQMHSNERLIWSACLLCFSRMACNRADADQKTVEGYNKQLDEAWKFFDAEKLSVLPILRRELSLSYLAKDYRQRNQANGILRRLGESIRRI
jgi:hypothetical protein